MASRLSFDAGKLRRSWRARLVHVSFLFCEVLVVVSVVVVFFSSHWGLGPFDARSSAVQMVPWWRQRGW